LVKRPPAAFEPQVASVHRRSFAALRIESTATMRAVALLVALLPIVAFAADDLTPLSDEFNDSAATLANWQRVYAVEGWGANQLESQQVTGGRMVMMPFTSTWFNDYRGELTFKEVTGDFVVTADVESTQRGGSGAPRSLYSLGGILIRKPRSITPAAWQPGGENYVFLAIGAANTPGVFQFEVKTTVASQSTLFVTNAGVSRAVLQVARIGPYVITLRNVQGTWSVHRRFLRPDFSQTQTLQVGMTTYTDYPTSSTLSPFVHNSTVIHGGTPDLVAAFDYFRFERPRVPDSLAGANLTDPNAVSDAQLLSFLGANAGAGVPARHRAVRK
jgi:hypothetical protein